MIADPSVSEFTAQYIDSAVAIILLTDDGLTVARCADTATIDSTPEAAWLVLKTIDKIFTESY
tara:strand:+ start:282 stop:470 length:189 start_codon:yes stop_codon:yes gene_type:complete